MTHWKLMFPTQFLAAQDLLGKDVTLTFRHITSEEIDTKEGKKQKWLAYFEETKASADKTKKEEKRMILNTTNCEVIAGMYGDQREDWIGKAVTFFGTTCQAYGKTVDCIRVRPGVPAAKAAK